MATPPEMDYPQLCGQVGLVCEECVAHTATELARACKGLRGKALGQLFVQIHPHPACSRMHAHFATAYRQARDPVPEIRPAAMAAVA